MAAIAVSHIGALPVVSIVPITPVRQINLKTAKHSTAAMIYFISLSMIKAYHVYGCGAVYWLGSNQVINKRTLIIMAKALSVYGCHVDDAGKILIIKDINSDMWGFPGGQVEAGESLETALIREFLEETGLQILQKPRFIIKQESSAKDRLFYRIQSVSGDLRSNGNTIDILQAGYYSKADIFTMNTATGVMEISELI